MIAKSGQEAIDIYEKRHDTIDLVILDVVMPDMGGEETLAQLQRHQAVGTGYAFERLPQVTKIMQRAARASFEKPFTINVLSQKLREALDAPRGGRRRLRRIFGVAPRSVTLRRLPPSKAIWNWVPSLCTPPRLKHCAPPGYPDGTWAGVRPSYLPLHHVL